MNQSVLNSIEPTNEFSTELLSEESTITKQEVASYIVEINKLSEHTERELIAFVEVLKELPKQREDQLRERIKALQYLPKQTKKELVAFVEHLKCFPQQTEEELSACVELIRYLPLRMKEMSDSVVQRLGKLPLHTKNQAGALIDDINSLTLPMPIKDTLVAYLKGFALIEKQSFIEKIKHLEKESQEQLTVLVDLIETHILDYAMIILFGSYAKGKAVIFDERYEEDGWRTTYQSDFDIMVVLPKGTKESKIHGVERRLKGIVKRQYNSHFLKELHAPPQFIVEVAGSLAKYLRQKNPFFTDIINEGILLFDNKEVVLPEPQELTFAEKKRLAEERFNECINFSDGCLYTAYIHLEKEWYKLCAFNLHQATENYYRAMGLVCDNYSPKLHELDVFIEKTKKYSRDLVSIFPQDTEFNKNTFKLLCDAYIGSRYHVKYAVTKEELEYMMERIEILKIASHRICKERIAYYNSMIGDDSPSPNQILEDQEVDCE